MNEGWLAKYVPNMGQLEPKNEWGGPRPNSFTLVPT